MRAGICIVESSRLERHNVWSPEAVLRTEGSSAICRQIEQALVTERISADAPLPASLVDRILLACAASTM
jgi:hypothetical protein